MTRVSKDFNEPSEEPLVGSFVLDLAVNCVGLKQRSGAAHDHPCERVSNVLSQATSGTYNKD
jgi:hypothetical protein